MAAKLEVSFHRVSGLRFGDLKQHSMPDRDFYTRDFIIENDDGEQEITLYSDNRGALEIPQAQRFRYQPKKAMVIEGETE